MKTKIDFILKIFIVGIFFIGTQYSCSSKKMMVSNITIKDSAVFKFNTTIKDFGFIKEGFSPNYTFEFTNVGNKPLVISNIETECSCTVSEFSKNPVLPNLKGTIKIIYKSEGNAGSMNKAITIFSNATEPEKKIYIKGKIVSMVKR